MTADSFKGKVVAITGAASGMGFVISKMLAKRGAILSIADKNEDGLQATMKQLEGEGHMYTSVDVRDSKSVDSWIEKTVQKLGKLDRAVNFAGVAAGANLVDTSDDMWNLMMDVNAKGAFNCIRAQVRKMPKGSSIVTAASVDAHIGWQYLSAYCASKHAVLGLCRAAAREHPGIRINTVAPGCVDTPMTRTVDKESEEIVAGELAAMILRRKAAPEEVANVVLFLLSDEASFVTGACYNVDGGWLC